MTKLRLVLGDQLNAAHPWFRQPDPDAVVIMMEVRSETDSVVHHAQKVLAIFAAMRAFARALRSAGHRVHYLRIGDARIGKLRGQSRLARRAVPGTRARADGGR